MDPFEPLVCGPVRSTMMAVSLGRFRSSATCSTPSQTVPNCSKLCRTALNSPPGEQGPPGMMAVEQAITANVSDVFKWLAEPGAL